MKKQKKQKKRKPWHQLIAEAIIEAETFDLSSNGDGWLTVKELIANYMLRNETEADRSKKINKYIEKVTFSFDNAVSHINNNGYHVYKHLPKGTRSLEYITTNRQYRDAPNHNYDRVTQQASAKIKNTMVEVKASLPERLPQFANDTKLLLSGKEENVPAHAHC